MAQTKAPDWTIGRDVPVGQPVLRASTTDHDLNLRGDAESLGCPVVHLPLGKGGQNHTLWHGETMHAPGWRCHPRGPAPVTGLPSLPGSLECPRPPGSSASPDPGRCGSPEPRVERGSPWPMVRPPPRPPGVTQRPRAEGRKRPDPSDPASPPTPSSPKQTTKKKQREEP